MHFAVVTLPCFLRLQHTCRNNNLIITACVFLLMRVMVAFLALLHSWRGAPFSRGVSTMAAAKGTAFVTLPTKRLRSQTLPTFTLGPFSFLNMTPKSFSSTAAAESVQQEQQVELLDPSQLFNGTIPYPKSLSPSSVMEFKKCPQSYLFQYLYGLRQPTNTALALGSMCHEALDKVFDLDPPNRTLEHLQNLFRSAWAQHRTTETYQDLFGTSSKSLLEYNETMERQWGQAGLKLLENYYHVEDPRLVQRPNPVQREIWLRADLTVDPNKGVTAAYTTTTTTTTNTTFAEEANTTTTMTETFHVRGIVDRLDMVKISPHEVALRIVDYKTGKAPNFKYSPAMNEQIASEAFYQLKIYALLLRETGAAFSGGLDLRMLRLLFLTSENDEGEYLDMDLGETQQERDAVLQQVHQDLANVWKSINELVATQDPKAFVGCNRSFCYCHKCRQRFVPGTVWEP